MSSRTTKLPQRLSDRPELANAYRVVEGAVSRLSVEDIYAILTTLPIWDQLKGYISPKDDEMEENLERAYEEALLSGLRSGNAAMVGRYQEYRAERQARKKLANITINITPYRIADYSLPRIVLQAEDEVVRQIEAALERRKLQGRVVAAEPAEPYQPEDSG